MIRSRIRVLVVALAAAVGGVETGIAASPLPATLPRPDGKPADMTKPVKVYILAGQSNMVGFGVIKGARPVYPSIFMSPDPAVVASRMPVGDAALLPLKVFQSADPAAAAGARAAVYRGGPRPGVDLAAEKPALEKTIALGSVAERLPSIDGPHTVVARAFVEVPLSGSYLVHAGFEGSSHAIVTIDGKEAYRRNPSETATLTKVTLERGRRYPVVVTFLEGGSAAFWMEHVDIPGRGDLAGLIAAGKFPWFADDSGAWTTRNDVIYREVRLSKEELGSGGPLTTTSNNPNLIGPEVPFGYVMGAYHDEPVLLIESSIGNRSLNWDFRPPSSGRTDPKSEWEGLEYRLMVEKVHKVLENLDKVVPGYAGQGYEIAGFVWWQGHKDAGQSKDDYERHLVNLIQDIRKEFKAPGMRAAVATVGFDGEAMSPQYQEIRKAQLAVGDPAQHPEFAGTVASVDTRGFWRSHGMSPTGVGYHYNHNAETFALTGDALGRAMVRLLGGTAENLALPPEPARDPEVERIYSDTVVNGSGDADRKRSPEQDRALAAAVRPIILDRLVPEFLETAFGEHSRRLPGIELKALLKGEKPARVEVGIASQLDTLVRLYEAAGIADYGWHAFGPEMKTAKWHYFSFDPPEKQDPAKSDRYRPITLPTGMERWFAPEFDPVKAGWKEGAAPFGQWDGALAARRPRCNGPLCGCSTAPATLWEKEVLLMRQTFELPPARPGHVYRVVLGGAGCDRSGEGFAIYVNGRQLTQINGGFYRDPGIRGAYVYGDIMPELDGGKVTIAVINFLRYTHFRNGTIFFGSNPDYEGKPVPPNGHVSLWIEEAKVPKAALDAAAR